MRLTTIYLEPALEVLLKLEMQRQNRPMAEIVREAVHAYVTRKPQQAPPGAGAFSSGRTDTADPQRRSWQQAGWRRASEFASAKYETREMSVLLDTGIVYAYYDRIGVRVYAASIMRMLA